MCMFTDLTPPISRESIDTLPMNDSFSPLLHRIESAVRYRAIHLNDPVLEPSGQLTKFAHPDEDMVKKSARYLEALICAADVKKGKKET